ncbi:MULTISPECIES: Pr6Pr family membrane protein [unclassified Caballeronia]|uniref:Pr6Pr family membrane protein n=1 Tax=unclassified Caballeronia TaxID=2646786 RepID=UPI00285A8AA6|nr:MULTISPECIES: Pr6Pr family membrane protein [unclassified Caballeronia]MDR5754349.1 Pr6Pr family membrane protein [Caballeronia sp. LZ024]MDR5840727.1 Pr6Pr family membrane protein [Caballeronia sp. LZ031]
MATSNPPAGDQEPELPLHTPSVASLSMAAAIALIAWLALAAQTDITIDRWVSRGYTVFDGIERMSSYLTNLTVFLSAICFTCVATRARSPVARFFRQPTVVTAIVVYMVFVGIAYNVLLRYLWTPSGYRALVNECLHTFVPVLAALFWVFFVPRFHLSVRQCLLWLVYPLGYLCVTLLRGSVSDFYPYPFIDVGELGYPHVLANATLLVLAFLTLMGVFIAINHRRRDLDIPDAAEQEEQEEHARDER